MRSLLKCLILIFIDYILNILNIIRLPHILYYDSLSLIFIHQKKFKVVSMYISNKKRHNYEVHHYNLRNVENFKLKRKEN